MSSYADGGDVEDEQDDSTSNSTSKSKASRKGAKGLSNIYENMVNARQSDLAKLKAYGDSADHGIVPLSQKQKAGSAFSVAQDDVNALYKKFKIPTAKLPKTNLGDIDNYMDTPVDVPTAARGGLMQHYAMGGETVNGGTLALPDRPPIEQASINQSIGNNNDFPMANMRQPAYTSATSRPMSQPVIDPSGGVDVDPYSGEQKFADGGGITGSGNLDLHVPINLGSDSGTNGYSTAGSGSDQSTLSTATGAPSQVPTALNPQPDQQQYMAAGGMAGYAQGGIMSNLGSYSDGGRLLKGPGDGVSDSIPAVIGHKQPARLADGEFVVPARIVSELGNGSTEAGARKLYAMMERIQAGRKKSIGKGKVAVNSKADKNLPA